MNKTLRIEVAGQYHMRDNTAVGKNYRQRFLRKLEDLQEKRQMNALQRVNEEETDSCYISDILTADIDKPKSHNEV